LQRHLLFKKKPKVLTPADVQIKLNKKPVPKPAPKAAVPEVEKKPAPMEEEEEKEEAKPMETCSSSTSEFQAAYDEAVANYNAVYKEYENNKAEYIDVAEYNIARDAENDFDLKGLEYLETQIEKLRELYRNGMELQRKLKEAQEKKKAAEKSLSFDKAQRRYH
jgi:uncharacterized protein